MTDKGISSMITHSRITVSMNDFLFKIIQNIKEPFLLPCQCAFPFPPEIEKSRFL